MKKPQSTCLNCKKRYVGCHSECEEYIEFKKQLDIYYKERSKTLAEEWNADKRPWFHRGKR